MACEAAAALANLARNEDNRRALVEGGAVGATLALAESPHAETARQAARTLCNLSLSPHLRPALVHVRPRTLTPSPRVERRPRRVCVCES